MGASIAQCVSKLHQFSFWGETCDPLIKVDALLSSVQRVHYVLHLEVNKHFLSMSAFKQNTRTCIVSNH